jgi:inhibitor of cysteine peptidase
MRHPSAWLLALALAAPACGNPSADFEILPLSVNETDVLLLESFPVQVEAVVKGTLPSACSTVDEVSQRREGNLVEVTVLTRTRRGQVCIASLKGVTERVRLQGGFPPGDYLLRVNGKETRFQV